MQIQEGKKQNKQEQKKPETKQSLCLTLLMLTVLCAFQGLS